MSKIISKLFIAIILLTIIPMVGAGGCDCTNAPINETNYNTAIVDGISSEWNTDEGSDDFIGNMYEAGNGSKELLSKAYTRYNCTSEILYVMVLLEPGKVIDDSGVGEQYVKLACNQNTVVSDIHNGSSGQPTFLYITNDTGEKIGWEASANVDSANVDRCITYDLNIHTQVVPNRTSAFIDRCIILKICCSQNDIPEFPTIALPIAAILGLMFILQSRRRKED